MEVLAVGSVTVLPLGTALLQYLLPSRNSDTRTPGVSVVLSSELKSNNGHVILKIS